MIFQMEAYDQAQVKLSNFLQGHVHKALDTVLCCML